MGGRGILSPMLLRVLIAALFLVPTGALAAETAPSVEAPSASAQKSRAEQLDELFATLKSAPNKEAADAAESSINRIWLQSGSDTVDLLMIWSLKAMSGLGMILRELDQDKRAIEVFRAALAIDPYLDDVKKALGQLEAKQAGEQT